MNTSAALLEGPRIRFGTVSFSFRDWVGPFYPKGTRPENYLRAYAQAFDTVEIDTSYYGIPSPETVEGWAQDTPETFLFTAKFPKIIVHGGKGSSPDPRILLTRRTYRARDRFLEVISRLGNRLGPLLLQFPYLNLQAFSSLGSFMARLNRFLADLPRDFRYAIEIRNPKWFTPEFADFCRRHDCALVLMEQTWMPRIDQIESVLDPVTTDFSYVRLTGNRQLVEGLANKWNKEVLNRQRHLDRWAAFLQHLNRRQVHTLVYINNHFAGFAPATVRHLARMVYGGAWQEVVPGGQLVLE